MVLLGLSYCVYAAVLWPSIQFLVDPSIVGTANGLATSMQMLGIVLQHCRWWANGPKYKRENESHELPASSHIFYGNGMCK